jgi:hypothetical protein
LCGQNECHKKGADFLKKPYKLITAGNLCKERRNLYIQPLGLAMCTAYVRHGQRVRQQAVLIPCEISLFPGTITGYQVTHVCSLTQVLAIFCRIKLNSVNLTV